MRRLLLSLLAVLPFLVCVSFWVASYLPPHWHLQVLSGNVLIVATDMPNADEGYNIKFTGFASVDDVRWQWRHAGFGFGDSTGGGYTSKYALFPIYVPTVAAGLFGSYALVRMRRRTWQGECKRCQNCGYDLRATPDRCPECGTIPKPSEFLRP
jgi:hypothetical protein